MHPVEVLLLIDGLPETSRFHARLLGEPRGRGWSRSEWLAFDTRNAIEGIRAQVGTTLTKKPDSFREWNHYPGVEAEKARRRRQQFDRAWRGARIVEE